MTRLLIPLLALLASLAVADPLVLATNGTTSHRIALAAEASPVDRYAAETLQIYLKEITQADFRLVEASSLQPQDPAIFIGLGPVARQRLGKVQALAEQAHVARTAGQDIFLYGEGIHGQLHATQLFLEEQLGWRWYTVFDHPVMPEQPTLALTPFHETGSFDFLYRSIHLARSREFPYQLGFNMRFDKWQEKQSERQGNRPPPRSTRTYVSALHEMAGYTHSLHRYVPPHPNTKDAFPWLEQQAYFETNPEFFTLWQNGERVPNKQLCFANQELRETLTRHVLQHIQRQGDDLVVEVAAMDAGKAFCYCQPCQDLEARYESPGGPIYDYLLELAPQVAKRFPQARIKTFAYRRSQTQKPPKLPAGQRLPANLIVEFAAIEDSYFADWSHPDPLIQGTWTDLQAWSAITTEGNLWAWLYPNPWGSGHLMPLATVQRLINQLRQLHAAGVRGYWVDHGITHHNRSNWSELQLYLLARLSRDIDADTDAIIDEFFTYAYGPAAPLMHRYLNELEAGRQAMTDLSAHGAVDRPGPHITYKSTAFDAQTFPYLTIANIHRWQRLFDDMEARLSDDSQADQLHRVRLARRELDLATLWKWPELQAAFPAVYDRYQTVADRVTLTDNAPTRPLAEWEEARPSNRRAAAIPRLYHLRLIREFAQPLAPLPPPLEKLDSDTVVQLPAESAFFISRWGFRGTLVADPAAAGGLAVQSPVTGFPFTAGYYNEITKTQTGLELDEESLTEDSYQLYRVGQFPLGREGYIWLDRSWRITFNEIRDLYDPHQPAAEWELWMSLRFAQTKEGEAPAWHFYIDRILCLPADAASKAAERAAHGDQPDIDFAIPNPD